MICFTTMPKYGFFKITSPTIVEETSVSVNNFSQTNSPKWWGAPLRARSFTIRAFIGKLRTHIMEKQISVGTNDLLS